MAERRLTEPLGHTRRAALRAERGFTLIELLVSISIMAVLLLHGIGRSLEDWDLQFERLSADHRVIAVDVPGFGFSDRPDGPITLSTFAKGVLGTVDVLGETRPVHIIGNSLGGAIAMQVLAHRPERLASLA